MSQDLSADFRGSDTRRNAEKISSPDDLQEK